MRLWFWKSAQNNRPAKQPKTKQSKNKNCLKIVVIKITKLSLYVHKFNLYLRLTTEKLSSFILQFQTVQIHHASQWSSSIQEK